MAPVRLPSEFGVELDPGNENKVAEGKTPRSRACSLSEALTDHPGLPYTTVLTIDGGSVIPMIDFHCRRLLKGMEKLCPDSQQPSFAYLKDSLIWLISYVTQFRSPGTGELQLVPMLESDKTKLFLLVHASNVVDPMSTIALVDVECRGKPRTDPQIKDTAWVTQRKPLEEARANGVGETILVGVDNEGYHSLLEGLVTNVYIVTQNLEIWTAPDHLILPGSLRHIVLAACEELGVQVVQRPIPLADYKNFDSAFLTNARRYLHPIRSMYIPDPAIESGCPQKIDLPNRPASKELVDKLRSIVYRILAQSSTMLLPSTDILQNGEQRE